MKQVETNIVHNKDVMDALKMLPDRSIDVIITDPPYYGVVSDDWDNQWASVEEYLLWCAEWIKESKRVLKRSGSFFIFGWNYQLSKLIQTFEDNGYSFRQNITIWKGLASIAGRASSKLKIFPTATEYIHYYHVDSKEYIRNLLQSHKIRLNLTALEINTYLGAATNGGGIWSSIAGPRQKLLQEPTKEIWLKLDKLFGGLPKYEDIVYTFNSPMGLTDVWNDINFYDKEYKKFKFHTTQKPLTVLYRLIAASTNEGDIVLDMFGGSGSTAIACIDLKRKYILNELDDNYYNKSKKWISNHKMRLF